MLFLTRQNYVSITKALVKLKTFSHTCCRIKSCQFLTGNFELSERSHFALENRTRLDGRREKLQVALLIVGFPI